MNSVGLSLQPQWSSVSIELTLSVPGPQGLPGIKGERGDVGPPGPSIDVTTLALDAGYF